MKMKLKKYVAIGIAVIGLIHIATTFTPVIAGKLEQMDVAGLRAFSYMSLMCGALLVLGGMNILLLTDKQYENTCVKNTLRLTEALLVNGIIAACMMLGNPCAWIILILAIPLPFCP